MVNRFGKRFPLYPDDSDYNTNAPSYYDDLARKSKLIQLLSERIWEYDDRLDLTLKQINNRLTEYIKENNDLMSERLKNWDERVESLDTEVINMMNVWMEDGTLDHIINDKIFSWKADISYVDNEIKKQNDLLDEFKKDEIKLKPSGSEDTDIINYALETYRKVTLSSGEYDIDGSKNIIMHSNQELIFMEGAYLKIRPQESPHYNGINIQDVENVIVDNPVIYGDRFEHLGTTGDWGHGIQVMDSDNVFINNARIYNTWGDGIYIANNFFVETAEVLTGRVIINHPIIDKCSRNGITVGGGRYVEINNAIISNIDRTLPKASIDIEPEGINADLGKLVINNLITENCDYLTINLSQLSNKDKSVDIQINGHVDNGSHRPFFYNGNTRTNNIGGSILLRDANYKNNRFAGIAIENPRHNTPRIIVDSPRVENSNELGQDTGYNTAGISIYAGDHITDNYPIANVDIINAYVHDTREDKKMLHPIYVTNRKNTNSKIEDVNIINPLFIMDGNIYSDTGTSIRDERKIMVVHPTYFEQAPNKSRVHTGYTNRNMSSTLNINLIADYPENTEITFEIINSYNFNIKPPENHAIVGLGEVNEIINGSHAGSSLTLKRVGNRWYVTQIFSVNNDWYSENLSK